MQRVTVKRIGADACDAPTPAISEPHPSVHRLPPHGVLAPAFLLDLECGRCGLWDVQSVLSFFGWAIDL